MFAAIRAFFAVFVTVFVGLEKGANALNNLATIGEEMSAMYLDTSRSDREVNAIKNDARRAKAKAKALAEAAILIDSK